MVSRRLVAQRWRFTRHSCSFGSKTAEFYREQIEFPFFNHWLKGRTIRNCPRPIVFETGTNQWRKRGCLAAQRRRAEDALSARGRQTVASTRPTETGAAFDEYVSDPDKPVPYIAGAIARDDARAHGGRPALRVDADRCADLSNGRARPRMSRLPVRSRRRCSFRPPAPIPTGW